jgi:hypothetical protein
MKNNVGGIDRLLRIALALLIGLVGIYYQSWWGLLGLIPLITGLVGSCGLYTLFGWTSCKKAVTK